MVAYSFQQRFVAPIQVGLGTFVITLAADIPPPKPKRQTIRAVGKKRHAKPGENVQLYFGLRTKACFQIGTGLCTRVRPIVVRISALANHKVVIDREPVDDIEAFARSDGFASWEDMKEFWKQTHGKLIGLGGFQGVLIEWEPIR